jgi:hypothetical protein
MITLGNALTQSFFLRNTEAISDGSDYESIESIRNNGSNLFYAGYRCGTLADWKNVLESISYIYKATVWTVNDIGGSLLLSDQNKIYITAITSTGDELTFAQKSLTTEELTNNYKSDSEVIDFQSLIKIYPKFDITGKIQNKAITTQAQLIKDTLYVNASTCTERYEPTNKPIIVDLQEVEGKIIATYVEE